MNTHVQDLAQRAHELAEHGDTERADEVLHLATLGGYTEDETPSMAMATCVPHECGGVNMADVEEEEVPWLWKNWLLLGYVNLFFGPAGCGKSTFWSDIAARITTDRCMPDGTEGVPGGVVVISLEEATASIVRPRLRKAGADLTKIIDLSRVRRSVRQLGDPLDSPFQLPDDLPVLEAAIRQVNAVLVIIDPLMSAVNPTVSTFRNQSARTLISTFQDMAERLGVAVLIVNHLIKGNGKDPLQQMAGSKGFTDIVRSAFMVQPNPSNPKQRVISLVKHNLAPDDVAPIVFQRNEHDTLDYLTGVTVQQAQVQQAQRLSETKQHVLALLEAEPDRAFTPTELAQRLDIPCPTMRKELCRMYEQGLIRKTARSMYTCLVPHVVQMPARISDAVVGAASSTISLEGKHASVA